MSNEDNEINFEHFISSFREPMQRLSQLQQQRLKLEGENVKNIIRNKVTNESILERTFDNLLDLTYWYGSDMHDVYYQLLNYFKSINPQVSKDYEDYYLEIIKGEDFDDVIGNEKVKKTNKN